mgnify:CR=1 FL=1
MNQQLGDVQEMFETQALLTELGSLLCDEDEEEEMTKSPSKNTDDMKLLNSNSKVLSKDND